MAFAVVPSVARVRAARHAVENQRARVLREIGEGVRFIVLLLKLSGGSFWMSHAL